MATKSAGRTRRRPAMKPGRTARVARPKFGRPGTAGKAEGDAAVRAWLAGVKPEHRPIVEKLDSLIGATVPGVKRAVKWSMPMYGLPGIGWFANIASFKNHVRLGFFAGTSLDPPPPVGEGKGLRQVNLKDLSDFDERLFQSWIQQAASRKGWGTV